MKPQDIIIEKRVYGNFGEGAAIYYKDSVSGLWFSCNGFERPVEIRWQVRSPVVIACLEKA